MAYPDFTLSYGTTSVTLDNFNIVSWSRAMIEPDANDLYKGIPVRINGNTLHRWSLSLIASSEDTNKIKQIYRESTRDRFNKELPGVFEVALIDNAELSSGSANHDVLFATCIPKPISCDRYEIELELIEVPVYLYVPSFTIEGVVFNQSEVSSYDSSAVIEDDDVNSWEWSLGLILDSTKFNSLIVVYNNYILAKTTPPYSDWAVSVLDTIGAGIETQKCEITNFSHTTSVRGFEVQITLRTVADDTRGYLFQIGDVTFAGREIENASKSVLVTRGIEIIPTGATIVSDNCGPGIMQWNCSFKSTFAKCNYVVNAAVNQRVIQMGEGNWLVPIADGVNGGTANVAIESASMSNSDKYGKFTLSVDLRQVNP